MKRMSCEGPFHSPWGRDAMNTMVPMCFKDGHQEDDFFLTLIRAKEKIAERGEKWRTRNTGSSAGVARMVRFERLQLLQQQGGFLPGGDDLSHGGASRPDGDSRHQGSHRASGLEMAVGYWTFWYDKARKRPDSEPTSSRLINYIEDNKSRRGRYSFHAAPGMWDSSGSIHQLSKIYKPIPVLLMNLSGKREGGTS